MADTHSGSCETECSWQEHPFTIGDVCKNITKYSNANGNENIGNGKIAGIIIELDKPIYGDVRIKYVLFTNSNPDITAPQLNVGTAIVGLEVASLINSCNQTI